MSTTQDTLNSGRSPCAEREHFPTYEHLVGIEPRLRILEAELAVRGDAFTWADVKAKLKRLVGWYAENEIAVRRHPELETPEAWQVAVNHFCERFAWL